MLDSLRDFYAKDRVLGIMLISLFLSLMMFIALFSCFTVVNMIYHINEGHNYAPLALLLFLIVSLAASFKLKPVLARKDGVVIVVTAVFSLCAFVMVIL